MINFFFPHIYRSWIKLKKLDEDMLILYTRIQTLQLQIEGYKNRIGDMDDDFQREKVARNKLQMVKEQEEIYRFINKKQEEL
ncbi:septum formation initiator family protein [Fusobacterium sp.]|uniref:septum formation initiator family protein n=1 Tax=Fusobacterium sp. TaxID=68766 RepID=UPI00396CE9E6